MVFIIVWTHVNVVVSNSMYPVLKRGDLVVVENAHW
ncbi:MAG TPA: S26 family signal peptidase, partial [Methanothermococcus okinawensis]|nr:S26 family signal peptidase [Methanothermococcus okinawensis]